MAVVLTVLSVSVLFIASSFSIDLGGRAQQKRNDHLIADMAALDGIRGVGTSALVVAQDAQASAVRNHWFSSSSEYLLVSRGLWKIPNGQTLYSFVAEDTYKVVDGSSTPTKQSDGSDCDGPCNAVQVQAFSPYTDLFQRQNGTVTLSAQSTVTLCAPGNGPTCSAGEGQFQIGSYLVDVNISSQQNTLFGKLLSPLLGSFSNNLTLVGYQGLANDSTTLGLLGAALGFSALTPSQLLASNITLKQLLNAEIALLGNGNSSSCSGGTANAACSSYQLGLLGTTLASNTIFTNTQFTLASALGMANVTSGDGSALNTTVNLLNAFNGAVAIADGTNAVAAALGFSLGGVTVNTSLALISPPQMSNYGLPPQSATDTQIAFTSTASLTTTQLIGLGLVNLTVGVTITGTVANASATMTTVTCPGNGAPPTNIITGPVTFNNIAGANGTGGATITGTVSGTLLGLSLGSATLTGTISQTSHDPAASHTLAYTTNFANNPSPTPIAVNGTLGSASISLSQSGATGSLLTALTSGALTTIGTLLSNAITGASGALQSILTPLGISIGNADLLGIRAACPVPTIVG